MEQKIIFREMLSEIKNLAGQRGGRLTVGEIDDFFANAQLEPAQMELIYEYLQGQGITVEGYGKGGLPEGVLSERFAKAAKWAKGGEKAPLAYGAEHKTAEEEEDTGCLDGMRVYLEEMERIGRLEPEEELLLFQRAAAGDREARGELARLYLPMICEAVGDYDGEEILVEDLIQEGNMGLLMTLEKLEVADSLAAFRAQLMNGVNRYLQEVLERQRHILEMGKGIENRVNHLSQAIHSLEEELEHRVSVEELSAYLEMPAEEIRDILKMAGDELKVEGYENR